MNISAAAIVLTKSNIRIHVTPFLWSSYSIPVFYRTDFKTTYYLFHILYILQNYKHFTSMRSSDRGLLVIPQIKAKNQRWPTDLLVEISLTLFYFKFSTACQNVKYSTWVNVLVVTFHHFLVFKLKQDECFSGNFPTQCGIKLSNIALTHACDLIVMIFSTTSRPKMWYCFYTTVLQAPFITQQ